MRVMDSIASRLKAERAKKGWSQQQLADAAGVAQGTVGNAESGTTYTGELQAGGGGTGTLTIRLGDKTCTGPAARVASNETFGFANSFGSNNRGTTASAFTTMSTSGDSQVKAILTCTGGGGLRCDLTGPGASGGGICVDDTGRVYDALAIRK